MLVVSVAMVGADLVVLAQNSNSSTTMQNDNTSGTNMNMGSTRSRGRRRGRRGRRNASMNGNMNANMSPDMQGNANADMAGSMQDNANMTNTNTATGTGRRGRRRGRRRAAMGTMDANANANTTGDMSGMANTSATAMPRRRGGCDPTVQEQTDLSGTYTGMINYPDGGLTGDATMTIAGNQLTITSGTQTINGRITAVTTCNYTSAALMLGPPTTSTPGQPAPAPPTTVSV
ncbi:MAG TPA: hypothetical protein VGB17_14185, partial [Pyrinomonadaceae bacterium]